MKHYRLTIFALFTIAVTSCQSGTKVSSGKWTLAYRDGIDITCGDTPIARGLTAEYVLDGKNISTDAYRKRKFRLSDVNDRFGNGRKWEIVYKEEGLPTLTQTFYLYAGYLLTDIALSSAGGTVRTNYMAPIVLRQTDTIISNAGLRRLFVPFDNDAWIRYQSKKDLADTLRSYEVTSVYNAFSRRGIVIGAVEHHQWKNAVDLLDKSRRLRVFSGVADKLTRDHKEHGYVEGATVRSAKVMIGLFDDWREGMETYADVNAIVAEPRRWDKAVPVGWNSWGALAFKVNHGNSTRISDFFAQELQHNSFANPEGLLYTGLDSGWNNFSEEELADFAGRCRKNNQVPCIYWTPFTDWGKNPERNVPGAEEYKYKDIYLYANGKPQELDGAYAIDPTHPAVRKMMEQTADLFRRCGYGYVKMDFMTHGRMEADRWHRKDIATGTEAYNYGMHLLDSIFGDMYLNLSISPIFPAQYAQSRRIACDAWNKIKDTEYTMNALSYGWWIDRVYGFNDADHVVLRDATEGENRARITSAVITGMFITGDDFSADSVAIARAKAYLTNPDINRIATGRSFRPLNGDDEQAEHAFIRKEKNGDAYLAVFNYSDSDMQYRFDLPRMGIGSVRSVTELWSHAPEDAGNAVTIPAKDVKVFLFKK